MIWTRNIYKSGSVLLALTVITALFDRIMYQWMGNDFYGREWATLLSFKNWYVVENVVYLAGALFLIRYYHYKRYRIVFWTSIVAVVISSCFAILVYLVMSLHRGLQNLYSPMMFVNMGAHILMAASLIFSESGKRHWLKWSGIILGLAVSMLLALNLYLVSSGLTMTGTPEKLNQALAWINTFVPILFILNFLDESKHISAEKQSNPENLISENQLNILIFLCVGVMLWFGKSMIERGYVLFHVPEDARIAAQPFEAGSYASSTGDSLLYRFMKPLNYDPNAKYPLVVCLPFFCADDNERQILWNGPAEWLSEKENRSKYPAFIFVPRCPRGAGWGGIPNNPSIEKLALEAIASLAKQPGIDPKRIYVTGVSRGGYGSWQFIGTRPDLFAAAVPVCGGGDPTLGKNMVNVAVWAFHGAKDKNVPVSGSRDFIAAIKRSGGNPRYTEFPDLEHAIYANVKTIPGLLDWLFAQKRK
jgi:hypothetical protein